MNRNPLGYINNQPPALFFFSPLRLALDIDRNGVVKIDPDPEGLNGRDEAGNETGVCHGFEIDRQSIDGAAAEIPRGVTSCCFALNPNAGLRPFWARPNEKLYFSQRARKHLRTLYPSSFSTMK